MTDWGDKKPCALDNRLTGSRGKIQDFCDKEESEWR